MDFVSIKASKISIWYWKHYKIPHVKVPVSAIKPIFLVKSYLVAPLSCSRNESNHKDGYDKFNQEDLWSAGLW